MLVWVGANQIISDQVDNMIFLIIISQFRDTAAHCQICASDPQEVVIFCVTCIKSRMKPHRSKVILLEIGFTFLKNEQTLEMHLSFWYPIEMND